MPTIDLPDRAVVAVNGPDAEHFLQNIVTADLADLPPDAAKPCALLTPQGKILFDFLVSKDGDASFRLDVRADVADDFIRRLMLYRLRAKVDISKQDQTVVGARWEPDSNTSQTDSSASRTDSTEARDLRFPDATVFRIYGDPKPDTPSSDWASMRIAHGVAESGADYALGDAFPHDVLLDQNGGVGFRKGCYIGQEVVSRMQHRGTARRRVLIAAGESALPTSFTGVTAGGRTIGALGTVAGDRALAIVRIDKIKDAMESGTPILAGDVALTLAIPPAARFTFPLDAPSEDA